jgi:hypothetical protein
MDRAITRAALLLLVGGIVALAAACGGSEKESARDPKATLADVKPLPSAQTAVAFRILFDNAPASVGDKVELTFDGPLRNNGPDKLPSLDWKVAFSGLATKFTSRIVSTGNNFFINLGGQDFEAGEQAVQQLADQARASKQKGLAQVGLNPLAAVRDVKDAGDRTFDGETLAVYKGAIDLDVLMDQVERLSQGLPTNGAAQTIPQGRLTAQQRGQVKRMFGSPASRSAWPTTTPSASCSSPPSSRRRPRTARPRAASPAGAWSIASPTPPSARRPRSPRPRRRSRWRTLPARSSAFSPSAADQ